MELSALNLFWVSTRSFRSWVRHMKRMPRLKETEERVMLLRNVLEVYKQRPSNLEYFQTCISKHLIVVNEAPLGE